VFGDDEQHFDVAEGEETGLGGAEGGEVLQAGEEGEELPEVEEELVELVVEVGFELLWFVVVVLLLVHVHAAHD
jgi:hypothetical protein